MAERDRAAVDVQLLAVEAELADDAEDLPGEGLVDLAEVDVVAASGPPSRARRARPAPGRCP